MKHLISIFLLAISASCFAQVYYYLPKTILAVDVEYEEISYEQGPFYQYAERYLGSKDVVKENTTKYVVKSVRINTQSEPDLQKTYSFAPAKGQSMALVLNSKGILAAYNAELPERKEPKQPAKMKETASDMGVMPLMEETMLASSLAKMAEGAAKQIYRIREARINLLAGDVEHVPADGKAMKLTLDEMNHQEAELVALFMGKTTRKLMHKTVLFTPEDNVNEQVLFRFSQFGGVVPADDLSGEPYYLTLAATKVTNPAKKEAASIIYYNNPGSALVTITDGVEVVAERTVQVAQFGFAAPLSMDIINRQPHILFNTKSGAIQSITE